MNSVPYVRAGRVFLDGQQDQDDPFWWGYYDAEDTGSLARPYYASEKLGTQELYRWRAGAMAYLRSYYRNVPVPRVLVDEDGHTHPIDTLLSLVGGTHRIDPADLDERSAGVRYARNKISHPEKLVSRVERIDMWIEKDRFSILGIVYSFILGVTAHGLWSMFT